MTFARTFDLRAALAEKSLFLLGPRQTGKSTLLHRALPEALFIDLLDPATFRQLAARPEALAERVHRAQSHGAKTPGAKSVIIDEIQKLPELLDVVHKEIEADKTRRFALTGSSARKLRRAGTNLLGGRARMHTLHPITTAEAASAPAHGKSWQDLVAVGGLPSVLLSERQDAELEDYVGVYLREEIQAEAAVRSLASFSRFLDVAAACNGELVVFSSIGNDAQVPARTVRDYFQLLDDTLIGELVPAFRDTEKRKARAHAKFFLFDVGVANAMAGRLRPRRGTSAFGKALEHLVYCELRAYRAYRDRSMSIAFWRSLSQLEVDFVLSWPNGRTVGVEVKASAAVGKKDARGLLALGEDVSKLEMWIVADEPAPRRTSEGVWVWPIAEFFRRLWDDRLV